MYAHSSSLSLAARLHRCGANCSCYINNGWTFSRQTSYASTYFYLLQFLSSVSYNFLSTDLSHPRLNLFLSSHGSVDWVPACKSKGHQFESSLVHMPGLRTSSSRGHTRGNPTLMFLSLFLPPFPSLKKIINLKKKLFLGIFDAIVNGIFFS